MIDRETFFDRIRTSLFGGNLNQSQVDGIDNLIDVWEKYFEAANPRDGNKWLAYCMATVFHETDQKMQPIEEYGQGEGQPYGAPTGPYGQCYYGRGHVQLTWEENYVKATQCLADNYQIAVDVHKEPEHMLTDQVSALVLYDGMINGWYTGVGLPQYFNSTIEDPVNARKIVNALDKADLIAGYYQSFKAAIVTMPESEPQLALPLLTISSTLPIQIIAGANITVVVKV